MINTNNDDRIEMAQEIAEIRNSSKTNMFDRQAVIDLLYENGYDFTAEYIIENKDDYLELLKLSANY